MSYGLDSVKYEDGKVYFSNNRLRDIVYHRDWDSSDISVEEYNNVDVAEVVQDEITDTTRWSVHHECVFKLEDKFYMTDYSVGATEMQDESPYEYDGDWVRVTEVEEKQVTVTKFVPVGWKS